MKLVGFEIYDESLGVGILLGILLAYIYNMSHQYGVSVSRIEYSLSL